jgi:hypothetical protein
MIFAGFPNFACCPKKVLFGTMLAALALLAGSVASPAAGPFSRLAGEWQGNGQINLGGGNSEPVKCRAGYDITDSDGNNLQLNIRCAGQSYSFELRGTAIASGEKISGNWSEATRNASGTISGTTRGDRFEVVATGPSFSASLTLITRGAKQSVAIRSADPNSQFKGASIDLQRG